MLLLLLQLQLLRTGSASTVRAAKKHIDWYCQECPIDFLDASTGGRPDLVDGIIPCCGSVDNGHHRDTALRINCSTGTLVDYSLTTDLSHYAPFTAAGRSVNMDLNGFAACCHNETDCTILESKEKLAAQLLAIGLKYKFDGFSMDWEFGQSFHWAGFNETMSYVAGVLRPHGAPHQHFLPCHSFSHTNLKSPCAEQGSGSGFR